MAEFAVNDAGVPALPLVEANTLPPPRGGFDAAARALESGLKGKLEDELGDKLPGLQDVLGGHGVQREHQAQALPRKKKQPVRFDLVGKWIAIEYDDEAAKDARIAELEAALAQAQQAPVAPPAAAALASVTGRLRELASLRASGALTEAQFERAKNTELGLQ